MTLSEYLFLLDVLQVALGCKRWDIRCCVSPTLHRKYWKYDGKGRFSCEICRKLERVCA